MHVNHKDKKKLQTCRFIYLKLHVRNIFKDKSNHEKLLWHCETNEKRAHFLFVIFSYNFGNSREEKKQEAFLDVSIAEKWHYVQEKKIKKKKCLL